MLCNGIDSFADDYCELEGCDQHCLIAFFDARDAILNVFKKHPELQNDPYQECIYGFPKRPALGNPIYKVARENNLEIFGPSLAKLSMWSDVGEVMEELEEEIVEAIFSESRGCGRTCNFE